MEKKIIIEALQKAVEALENSDLPVMLVVPVGALEKQFGNRKNVFRLLERRGINTQRLESVVHYRDLARLFEELDDFQAMKEEDD